MPVVPLPSGIAKSQAYALKMIRLWIRNHTVTRIASRLADMPQLQLASTAYLLFHNNRHCSHLGIGVSVAPVYAGVGWVFKAQTPHCIVVKIHPVENVSVACQQFKLDIRGALDWASVSVSAQVSIHIMGYGGVHRRTHARTDNG